MTDEQPSITVDRDDLPAIAAALGTTPEQLQAALARPMLPGGHLETLMRVQERARKVFGPETGNRKERRAAKAQRGRQ